jgi:proline iminopeptidase
MNTSDGYVEVPGGRVWYSRLGDGSGKPILCLHGGPGFPHDYISSLQDLAPHRPVIFYDQLGCGRSERPDDPSLWIIERFVEELHVVRQALGLDEMHLFGSSWGGTLALLYLLEHGSEGIASLTIAASPATTEKWMEYSYKLREQLPADVRDTITSHWDEGRFSCPEFIGATAFFYKRHLCRLEPWPACVEDAFENVGQQVYETMWGPTEFGPCTGVLNDLDLFPRLGEISIPTLLTIGEYDECPLEHYEEMSAAIPDSELVVFDNSSHMHFLEDREHYINVMEGFLQRVEAAARPH